MAAAVLAAGALGAGCAAEDPFARLDGGADYALLPDMLACLPNNNGVIEQNELVFKAGMVASFRTNPPGTLVSLDPAGTLISGTVHWEFSSRSGMVAQLKVEAVAGTWYGQHFPTGDIAMATTVKNDTLQVLDIQPGRVLLLGLASRKPGLTLTIYDPPVEAMKFPLRKGLSFSSTSSLKAGSKINGLPVTTKDTYSVSINTEGMLHLPSLKLQRTLLIETLVTSRTLGGVTHTTRQLQWFSECYGEVVRALSQLNETKSLFTRATELRKLSW